MHRLVGHLASANSDSRSNGNTSHKAMSSNEASSTEGTGSRDKTVSSNEASMSTNETKVGNGGGSGSSHKSNDRSEGLKREIRSCEGEEGVWV